MCLVLHTNLLHFCCTSTAEDFSSSGVTAQSGPQILWQLGLPSLVFSSFVSTFPVNLSWFCPSYSSVLHIFFCTLPVVLQSLRSCGGWHWPSDTSNLVLILSLLFLPLSDFVTHFTLTSVPRRGCHCNTPTCWGCTDIVMLVLTPAFSPCFFKKLVQVSFGAEIAFW